MRLVISCLIVVAALATPAAADEFIFSSWQETSYVYRVHDSDLKSAPLWKEDAKDPPLSARDAITTAKREVGRLFGKEHHWKVECVCIESHGASPDGEVWFWVVIFTPEVDPPDVGHALLRIPVMMN